MTQMPGFKDTLAPEGIAAVAEFISQPIPTPVWGEAEIAGSRTLRDDYLPAAAPVFTAAAHRIAAAGLPLPPPLPSRHAEVCTR